MSLIIILLFILLLLFMEVFLKYFHTAYSIRLLWVGTFVVLGDWGRGGHNNKANETNRSMLSALYLYIM